MPDCIFCQIIAKKIPSKLEYEDDEIIIFHDIKPKAPVHLLILPKKHIESVSQLENDDQTLIGNLVLKAREMAKKLKLEEKGFRLVVNNGPDSGQEVAHLHIHLLAGKKLGNLG